MRVSNEDVDVVDGTGTGAGGAAAGRWRLGILKCSPDGSRAHQEDRGRRLGRTRVGDNAAAVMGGLYMNDNGQV